MIHSTSAAGAKKYFETGLSKEDYYSQGQEIIGQWGGKYATEMLGLHGQVDKESFDALCDNINPNTGANLTARNDENRRVGYDINFHCPKSVSVLHAHTGDEQILEAFRSSVSLTMQEMESEMQTRVRRNGKNTDRTTGNMVWAEFIHTTARPVGGIPDPHLHAHCFTFNATYDHEESRWKAGQFGNLKRDAPYYEAAFHSRFAARLGEMGFSIDRTEKGWEIGGVPQSVIDKFSRRTAEIEQAAKEKGITNDKGMARLFNRRYLMERLASIVDLAKRYESPLSLCLCDLDKFKSINDMYGHSVGDDVLVWFSNLLKKELRTVDITGRFGGDEFCLIFPHTLATQAAITVERIRKQMGKRFFEVKDRGTFSVSGTFGIADFRSKEMTEKDLLDLADQALYQAKELGRNRVSIAKSR
jgi:conjugative relaxase-like TrwC/TraI family protein